MMDKPMTSTEQGAMKGNEPEAMSLLRGPIHRQE